MLNELSLSSDSDDKSHKLSAHQQLQLEFLKNLKEMFPSFNAEGLGRTNVHEHEIEIIEGIKPLKQRRRQFNLN